MRLLSCTCWTVHAMKILRESVATKSKEHKGWNAVCVIQLLVIVTLLCCKQTDTERESFTAPPPTCPSEKATFTCTVNDSNHHNGGRLATTYWQVGSDKDCALPHVDPTIVKECGTNNAFVARSQPPSGSYYTSTLQAIAHPSLNGSSVRCYVPDGQEGERTVGHGRLEVLGAPPAPSFLPINEDDIIVLETSVNVTLRWSEPQGYRHTGNITSYNVTANQTLSLQKRSLVVERGTVEFSQKALSFILPINAVVELTVYAEVCGTEVGNESSPLTLCIEVPEAVMYCSTTAVYNGSTDELTDIVVNWSKAEAPCYQHLIAPGLSSNIRSYTVSVNKQSNKTFKQEFVCDSESEQCSYTWNVADHEAVNYMVSVAANNVVGQSFTKNCTTTLIGQVNNILSVDMQVDSYSTLNVNCTLLGSFQGVGYCEIRLSNMNSTFTYWQRSQGRASAGESVFINNVTLNASTVYLCNVSAVLEDESTPMVVVQGVITTSSTNEAHRNSTQSSLPSWGIAVIAVGAVVVGAIALMAGMIVHIYHRCHKNKEISWSESEANRIDSEKSHRTEPDGGESYQDDESDGPRNKNGGPHRLYKSGESDVRQRFSTAPK